MDQESVGSPLTMHSNARCFSTNPIQVLFPSCVSCFPGFCLSELMLEWQDNRTTSLLKDLSACLLKPSGCHPPSPQPSTSRQSCPPALLSRYLATGWDTDRVRYKVRSFPELWCTLLKEKTAEGFKISFSVFLMSMSCSAEPRR